MLLKERIALAAGRQVQMLTQFTHCLLQYGPAKCRWLAQPKRAVAIRISERAQLVHEQRISVGREPHHLVFGTKGGESKQASHERVQHPEAILVRKLMENLNPGRID